MVGEITSIEWGTGAWLGSRGEGARVVSKSVMGGILGGRDGDRSVLIVCDMR